MIRAANSQDLKTIQQFGYQLLEYEHDNWDPTLELDWPFSEAGEAAYAKAISEKCTLIAEADNKAIGFLIGSVKRPAPGAARSIISAQLENIFVDDEMRGHGIGEKLAHEFKKYCLKEKADAINVTVNAKNKQATRFYEKVGFLPSRIFLSQELKK